MLRKLLYCVMAVSLFWDCTAFNNTSSIISFFVLDPSTSLLSLAVTLGFKQIAFLKTTNPNGFLTNNFVRIWTTKDLNCSLNSFTKTSSICFAANNMRIPSSAANPISFQETKRFHPVILFPLPNLCLQGYQETKQLTTIKNSKTTWIIYTLKQDLIIWFGYIIGQKVESKERKQIFFILHPTNCASKCLLEEMNWIEANMLLVFDLLPYLPFRLRSSFGKNFLTRVRIHKSVLMSSFIKLLPRSAKFWQHRKKCEVHVTSKLHKQSGSIVSRKLSLNIASLKWLEPERNLARNLIQIKQAIIKQVIEHYCH